MNQATDPDTPEPEELEEEFLEEEPQDANEDGKEEEEDREKIQKRLLRLIISEDGLKAFISVPMKRGRKKITYQDVEESLARKEVVVGVKRVRVKGLLSKLRLNEEVVRYVIAEGTAPKRGKDGEYHVRIDTSLVAGREDEDTGNIDLREREYVCNVKLDQILIDIIPAGEGTPGKSVLGEDLAAEPGTLILPEERINILEEENKWKAAVDGQFRYSPDKVQVIEEIVIDGDVDYEVGNIEYEGRIVIHGDIKPGFTVISRTGVLVRGEVMDGAQVSSEGPIDVEGNICLGEKGLIICGADLGADQILDSRVEVVGNVNVERLILNSNVVCGGHLTMVQPDSQIRGGRIEAVQGISVSIAGAPSGAPTVLVTGITLAYHEEAKKLGQAAGELSRRIDDAVSNYQKAWPAEEHETYVGPQRERFLDAKARVDQTSKIGMERLAKWKQRRQELRDKFAQCEDETMIKVLRRVLPGVMICIGPKANITIKQVIEKETFFQEKGEIRRLSLAN